MSKKVFFLAAPALVLSLLAFRSAELTGSASSPAAGPAPDTLRKDPICGMMADDSKKDTVHYKKQVYAFCSKYCKQEFLKDPEAYVEKKKKKNDK